MRERLLGVCGLDSVPLKSISFPEPQIVTMFGNRVIADVIG